MRILLADDEILALDLLKTSVQQVVPDAEIYAFSKASELFEFANDCACDIAFLDINMAGITGIELGQQLKELMPNVNIIFVTGYSEYTGEAMDMHASGYIMKPVTPSKVQKEIGDLRYPVQGKGLIRVQCFGNFDVFTPAGEPVKFSRSKAKELLAVLVSKKGSSCTVKELTSILFETTGDDDKKKDYTQQLLSTLMRKLKELGAEAIINKSYNSISVNMDKIDCDYYKFDENNPSTLSMYKGEFMAQYSWAEYINGYLHSVVQKK